MVGMIGGGQLGRMFTAAAHRLGYRVAVWSDADDAPALAAPTSRWWRPTTTRRRWTPSPAPSRWRRSSSRTSRPGCSSGSRRACRCARRPRRGGRGAASRAREGRAGGAGRAAGAVAGPRARRRSGRRGRGAGRRASLAARRRRSPARGAEDGRLRLRRQGSGALGAGAPGRPRRSTCSPRGLRGRGLRRPRRRAQRRRGARRRRRAGRSRWRRTTTPPRARPDAAARPRSTRTWRGGRPALAERVVAGLGVVGLACVELFLTRTGELWVNEVAPRPHNSGHVTLEACRVDQFEQQLRAVCGLPLGDPSLVRPGAMANLLGDLWQAASPTGRPRWRWRACGSTSTASGWRGRAARWATSAPSATTPRRPPAWSFAARRRPSERWPRRPPPATTSRRAGLASGGEPPRVEAGAAAADGGDRAERPPPDPRQPRALRALPRRLRARPRAAAGPRPRPLRAAPRALVPAPGRRPGRGLRPPPDYDASSSGWWARWRRSTSSVPRP
jgi:5-(carboxyamino)imidazole ribonucleotide synthase